MKLFVINGPNINFLGIREKELYGTNTYSALVKELEDYALSKKIEIEIYQSNHEGDLIDKIQEAYYKGIDGIIINAGGYTHTSISIMDALKAVSIKTVEVHLTDIEKREDYRKVSYISNVAIKTFKGKGFASYIDAMDYFISNEHTN